MPQRSVDPSNQAVCRPREAKLAQARRNEMHPEDLMKPDLFSEIVLLGSGGVIFVSLLLIIATALTRA